MRKICSSSKTSCSSLVELPGRLEVGAEGLLHDDPAALHQTRVPEQVHDRQGRLRGHAEVVQPPQLVGAELRLGLRDHVAQRLGAALAGCPADPLGELRPAFGVGSLPAVLGDGLAGELDEGVAVVVVERRAHHLHLVEQARLEQVQQPGEELALGEVTGGTEQDDGRGCRHAPSLLCGAAVAKGQAFRVPPVTSGPSPSRGFSRLRSVGTCRADAGWWSTSRWSRRCWRGAPRRRPRTRPRAPPPRRDSASLIHGSSAPPLRSWSSVTRPGRSST